MKIRLSKPKQQELQVGDLLYRSTDNELRLVVTINGKYLAIDLHGGYVGLTESSLKSIQEEYESWGFEVIKNKDVELIIK